MKRLSGALTLLIVIVVINAFSADKPPLTLIKRIKMPGISKSFDHLTADAKGNRLFVAAEWHKSIEVYDMNTGTLLHSITGMNRPHAMLYRDDLDRLYVTDGDDDGGALIIYDCRTYAEIKKIDLLPDTDSIGYDPATKYLYVTNGGEDAKVLYSFLTIIDTTSGEEIGEIKIDSDTIGGMRLETSNSRLYLDEPDKRRSQKTIGLIDRDKREQTGAWKVKESKREGAMALDEPNHRLFVGVIEGLVVVYNTETGEEIGQFPIGKGTDDIAYDPQSKRLYAACDDGAIYVYEQRDANHYKSLGKVASGLGARTGRLVPETERYFTAVPAQGSKPAELLVYKVQ